MNSSNHKVIIMSSPSGGGKTTIMKRLLKDYPELEFSISACSRSPRDGEIEGKDYYFLTVEEFQKKIADNEFLEWEEVYEGMFYGTLKSEVKRIWNKEHVVVFDVDVVGGNNLKNYFKEQALAIFIMPPSVEVLRDRLLMRGTETVESIDIRVARAEYELTFSDKYETIIINDDIETAVREAKEAVSDYLYGKEK
ncbi:MAG: guanylate kinase [Bacteroidales bacterium]|nr:guanylate kinase [Bacteroidales bacterium]